MPGLIEGAEVGCPDLSRWNYQKAFHINGEWLGQLSFKGVEQQRFDKVLPADMTGMSMIDVGACYGLFCYEAVWRGATTVVAVDCDPEAIALVQSVRDYYKLPITTVEMTIEAELLPLLGGRSRYDLALVLNILHHVGKRPGPLGTADAVLRNVLRVCNAVAIETPPIMRDQWPEWMSEVADSQGFVLTAEGEASHLPEERRLVKMERMRF